MGGIRKDSLWAFRGYGSCNVTKRLEDRLTHARLYDQQGTYRGNLSTNQYDPDSVSNPCGRFGNPYSPDSLNNQFGAGNPYRSDSPTKSLRPRLAHRRTIAPQYGIEIRKRPMTGLTSLGWQIHDHLKEHRPKMFQELKAQGRLKQTVETMQNQASERMASLENAGLYHHEACEIVRDDVLLPTEEDVPRLGESIQPYTD
jgi:hypothetical protein